MTDKEVDYIQKPLGVGIIDRHGEIPPLTRKEKELGRLSDRTESQEVLLRPKVSENLCFL